MQLLYIIHIYSSYTPVYTCKAPVSDPILLGSPSSGQPWQPGEGPWRNCLEVCGRLQVGSEGEAVGMIIITCVYVCVCVHMYIYPCQYMHVYMYIYIYIYTYAYTDVCIHTHTYTYTHTYEICLSIYLPICTQSEIAFLRYF